MKVFRIIFDESNARYAKNIFEVLPWIKDVKINSKIVIESFDVSEDEWNQLFK